MRYVFLFLCLISIIAGSSCQKKSNKALSESYYRLAMLEVSHEKLSVISYRKALEYTRKACDLYEDARYLAFEGTLLLRLNEHQESIVMFEKALNLVKDKSLAADIKNNLACAFAAIGDNYQAFSLWKHLVRDESYLTPEVALVNQGKLYVTTEEYKRASECFDQAISLAPNYSDAYFYAALNAYQQENFTQCKERLTALRFIDPHHKGGQQLNLALKL